jgi:16S rRNA (cytidine1402-2'-O)-methyltransferase
MSGFTVGILYLVSTPIGNLEDITWRAVRILKQVHLVAAEDTRQTRKLLERYDIQTRLTSYHEHNKVSKQAEILEALAQGDVALVSDAGTPAINDPGFELVKAVIAAGYPVSPIPGPSAPIAALVASGLPTDAFLYLGYLPRKSGERQRLLQDVAELPYTLVLLETPHRLQAALQDLEKTLGDRQICVAREITKLYEEFYRGSLRQALAHFAAGTVRGEFTLVVSGKTALYERWSEQALQAALREQLEQGASGAQIAAQMAVQSGWSKREVYKMLVKIQSEAA